MVPAETERGSVQHLNLSNFVREMSNIKNTINLFVLDMSRHNINSVQQNQFSEDIEPIYNSSSVKNGEGGLSIVVYSCGKGQRVKEISEQRFIQTPAKCFEGSRTFFTYL